MVLAASILTVYPRACGGTFAVKVSHALVDGLSPRLRGNRPQVIGIAAVNRSIPAPAGEPCRSYSLI